MILRARAAQVDRMLVVGYNQRSNRQALKMAETHDFMWATLGVHPCDVKDLTPETLEWMKLNAQNPKVVAMGEMGLDYHHMSFPKAVQAMAFKQQIRLANELGLPCIVHSRDAAEDTLKLLLEEAAQKVVFHCYSYDLAFAKKVWEAGYFTSFSGVVTYSNAKDIQAAAKAAPEDLLLLETDCPYLAPQSIRGKRNEIALVAEVGAFVADLRGVAPETLAQLSTQNAQKLFQLG